MARDQVRAAPRAARRARNGVRHDFLGRHRLLLIILLAVAGVLAALRLAAPAVIRHEINRTLKDADPFTGAVAGVGLSVLAGKISLDGLHVAYRQQPDSYFALPSIEANVEWGSLLHGALVGDLTIRRPIIRLHLPLPQKKPPTEKLTLARIKEDLSALRGQPSFWLRHIVVYDGTVELLTKQDYRLALEGLDLRLENLSNRQLDDPLRLNVESRVAPAGSFLARATATSLTGMADKTDAELVFRDYPLPAINPLLHSADVAGFEGGQLRLYSQLAIDQDSLSGYVKPMLYYADVEDPSPDEKLTEQLKNALVALGVKLLENPSKDRVATEVPISGTLAKPKPDSWEAFVNALGNAFVQAIPPGLKHKD